MSTTISFYLQKEEPVKSCLLAVKDIILAFDADITTTLKYGMPFFCYKKKMFCHLWMHKKFKLPYISFVEGKYIQHPVLISESRTRMKIMLLNPQEDLPVVVIKDILKEALDLYRAGEVKI